MTKQRFFVLCAWLAATALSGCGGGESNAGADAGVVVTTEYCDFEPMPAGANASGQVSSGALQAGAAERVLAVPVGTTLGGYTARAGFLGTAGTVDLRDIDYAGSFNPSIGVESAPRVKAVVLSADTETIVLIKIDAIFPYEGMTLDIAEELGPEFRGKVLVSASHSHSAWAQYTGHTGYQVGAGLMREKVYRAFVDGAVAAAKEALAGRRAAKLGILSDASFDPGDQINHDRRGENDLLPGGSSDDRHFYLIRIDGIDDQPIAVVPIYGVHGTLMSEDNSFAATDATGGMERVLEEKFDQRVVVMHLQGAAGDVAPDGHGSLDCDTKPGAQDDPCFDWAKVEGHGRVSAEVVYQAWQAAGASMQNELALEMLTRSVELGPDASTFTIRGGALSYAPFDYAREADQRILEGGELLSPIDEFNAPVGAALCEEEYPMFPAALMPGTDGLFPYGSCVRINIAGDILGQLLGLNFESRDDRPVCQSTRTLVSALRIGDYVIGTIPGELSVLLAERIRSQSPAGADNTIVLGYAQGFTGYSLTPEDWISGGFEASTNFWGPLEAEYLGERALELMDLALTSAREDGTEGGVDRISTPALDDSSIATDDPAPMLGTVPATRPDRVWLRTGAQTQSQPDATIDRVSGHAVFTWVGEDPKAGTPVVELQRETAPSSGIFEAIERRSGRVVSDAEVLLMYTPLPLRREDGPQTHYWSVEWQAVPWLGSPDGLDALDAIAGVPLARYRFHVEGAGYALDSDPFDVVSAVLRVDAIVNGQSVVVGASVADPKGYRLLDMAVPSNGVVPLRSQTVSVTVAIDGGPALSFPSVALDANGAATIDLGGQASSATQVSVEDRFGNSGSKAL